MRIAIIGTGIAGNAAAYALANSTSHRLPSMSATAGSADILRRSISTMTARRMAVDTGFIVYNEMNYPNLTALFAHLGIETQDSEMSFALSARKGGFEWCGRTYKVLDGLFAQRRNLVSPAYLSMLLEILRFNRLAVEDRAAGVLAGVSLGNYLHLRGFSDRFRDDYLIPMGAAIWSMSPISMLFFPAESFIAFFQNHHLLQWNRPVWRTVKGGSRRYVERMAESYRDRVKLGAHVTSIERSVTGVVVTDEKGETAHFDQVIIASHSDQALAMLANPTPDETAVLGQIGYRDNEVYLHRDTALMPVRRRAWAAWNVMQGEDPAADLCVTYWMNALQGMDSAKPLFVTLNPTVPPRADLTFGRYTYAHPQYTEAAIAAQKRIPEIQGRNRTWFCGAWTRHGFHEDGLASGIAVAEALGGTVPWRQVDETVLAEAAE